MNSQISVRLVVLFYAFLYVSGREEGYEAVPRRTEQRGTRVGTAGVGGYEAVPRRTEQKGTGEETAGKGGGDITSRYANYASRKCKFFSLTNPFYNRRGAEFNTRRGPSPFENMPFSVQEGRLLHARRACPQTLYVTY